MPTGPQPTQMPTETHWKPSLPDNPQAPSKKWLWWAVGGIVVLGLVGSGYLAYSRGYIRLPFLSPQNEGLFEKMIESISDIKSAQYSLRVNLTAEQRQGNTQPLFTKQDTNINGSLFGDETGGFAAGLLSLYDPDTILKSIPADIKFDGGVTFSFEADKNLDQSDALLKLDGTYSGSDSSVAVDLEARKIGKNVYGVINKFPSFFFIDVSALKGKWVAITPEDDTGIISETTFEQTDTKQAVEKLKSGLRTALQKGVFTVERQLTAETVAGVRSERYRIVFHSEKLSEVYQALISERQSKGEDTKQLQGVLDNLKKRETADLLKRMADSSVFDIWVDRTNGILRQAQWTLIVVPPDEIEKLKGKQFRSVLKLTLEHVNEKVKIEKPDSTIPYDEAARLLSGMTKEEQLAQKQISRIGTLQQVLKAYIKATRTSPDSLDQLTPKMRELNDACKQRAEQRKVNANANKNASSTNGDPAYNYETDYNCYLYGSYEKKTVNVTDTYTGKSFSYTKDGDDFRVTYELRIADSQQLSYYKETYADGTNTMNSKDVSLEQKPKYEDVPIINLNTNANPNPAASSWIDSDHDGISDKDELDLYHTDPNKRDTDGDSFSDQTEVWSGFNPNGTGRASPEELQAWELHRKQSGEPVVYDMVALSVNGSVTVTWKTDIPADGIVNFGTTTAYGSYVNHTTFVTDHRLQFSTARDSELHYAIRACSQTKPDACTNVQDTTINVQK